MSAKLDAFKALPAKDKQRAVINWLLDHAMIIIILLLAVYVQIQKPAFFSVPSLVNGAAISVTTILGYTALASAAGGGGLGALAITKGLNVRKFDIMYSASLLLVVLVQIITVFGTRFTRGLDHKKR